jgi:hypothetical protein
MRIKFDQSERIMPGYGEPNHVNPVFEGFDALLVPRMRFYDKEHLIEPKLIDGGLGEFNMPIMNRVECPDVYTDPFNLEELPRNTW